MVFHSRRLVRRVLESSLFRSARTGIVVREATKAARALELDAKYPGTQVLDVENLGVELDAADKDFFVLGSGSSVENLSQSNFQEIGQGVSVGINAWVLHDFVPSMYAYEPVDNPVTDHYRTLSYLDRPAVEAASPRLLILKPRNEFELNQLSQVPTGLLGRTRIYGRVSPYTRETTNLDDDLVQVLGELGRPPLSPILLDSGASIVRMAHLGVKMGFRRIVFVGVDLSDTRYFWESNPSYLEKFSIKHFDSGQRGKTHETLDARKRPFSVLDMLPALARASAELYNCEFFVGSAESLLARRLPVYSWGGGR